jgi:hypothetical protein
VQDCSVPRRLRRLPQALPEALSGHQPVTRYFCHGCAAERIGYWQEGDPECCWWNGIVLAINSATGLARSYGERKKKSSIGPTRISTTRRARTTLVLIGLDLMSQGLSNRRFLRFCQSCHGVSVTISITHTPPPTVPTRSDLRRPQRHSIRL